MGSLCRRTCVSLRIPAPPFYCLRIQKDFPMCVVSWRAERKRERKEWLVVEGRDIVMQR